MFVSLIPLPSLPRNNNLSSWLQTALDETLQNKSLGCITFTNRYKIIIRNHACNILCNLEEIQSEEHGARVRACECSEFYMLIPYDIYEG